MLWSWTGYRALLIASLLWTAGIGLSPVLMRCDAQVPALAARLFYMPVCHQDAARSPRLFGYSVSVCHRCSGIYVAFTTTVLFFPLFRQRRWIVSFSTRRGVIFIVPMLLDYFLDVAGIWQNDPLTRSISGGIGGAGLALFVVPAWAEAWRQLFVREAKQ